MPAKLKIHDTAVEIEESPAVLPADRFARGSRVEVRVTPFDDLLAGEARLESVVVANAAPAVTSATVTATGTSRAATAAAEPPELPPGTHAVFHGLRTAPKYEFSFDEPIASSSRLHLPTTMASSARRRSTTCAS
jgi:hypothetical protein